MVFGKYLENLLWVNGGFSVLHPRPLHSLQSAQRLNDFPGIRIAALAMLGKNDGAVGGDVEDAAATLDELGLHSELPGDLGRQTGGPGQVVSDYAVGDGDAHGRFVIREVGPDTLLRLHRVHPKPDKLEPKRLILSFSIS